MIKKVGKYIITLFLATLVGILVLMLSFCLPDKAIFLNMSKSQEEIKNQGDYPRLEASMIGTQLDRFSDAIILMHTVYHTGEHTAFARAINMYEPWQDEVLPVEMLVDYLSGETNYYEANYMRYWHGHVALLRFLFMVLDYEQILVFQASVLVLLLFIIIVIMIKRKMYCGFIAFCTAIIFTNPLVVFSCLHYMWVFLIALTGSLLCLLFGKNEQWRQGKNLYYFFFCIGMLTSYMDLLTVPMVTLAYPMLIYLVIQNHVDEAENVKKIICRMVRMVLAWCLGYVIFWAMKWLLVYLVYGMDEVKQILQVVGNRMSSDVQTVAPNSQGGLFIRLQAITRNLAVYKYLPYGLFLLFAMVLQVVITYVQYNRQDFEKRKRTCMKLQEVLPTLGMTLSPFLWYFVISNHSYIHYWFTYRLLTVSVFGMMLLIPRVVMIMLVNKRQGKKQGGKINHETIGTS